MAPERRSAVEEVALWEEVEEDFGTRCRRHASQPRYGVCPTCLKERLLRLCPECAHLRPCRCLAAATSSSSSGSSFSSLDLARSAGGEPGGEIGAIGPVLRLIESEPAFRRSRSVGMPLLRSRSVAASVYGDDTPASASRREKKGRIPLWPFRRSVDGKKGSPPMRTATATTTTTTATTEMDARLPRSRSVFVGFSRFPDAGGCAEAKSKGGWGRYFPAKLKPFLLRKASSKVDLGLSPPVVAIPVN